MKIEKIKDLVGEHERHLDIIKTINEVAEKGHWLKIVTPCNKEGECLSNMQIKMILDESKRRCEEIESKLS